MTEIIEIAQTDMKTVFIDLKKNVQSITQEKEPMVHLERKN